MKSIKKIRNINIYLYLYIIFISLSNEKIFRILYTLSEITITINGTGTQTILTQSGVCGSSVTFNSLPSKIYVNDVLQNYIDYKVYNLNNNTNKIRMEWNYTLTNCNIMFHNLKNIIEIDLSKFDSSKVTDMGCMFFNLSLTSLDLSHFNTSSCKNMNAMFKDCSSLKLLNLNNFNTSLVTSMWDMFHGCSSLISLDLNNFDTSNVINMRGMFYGCTSLKLLNLNNFNTLKVSDYNNIFNNVDNSLIYCINKEKVSNILSLLNNYLNNNCSNPCFTNSQYKFIIDKITCIDECSKDPIYKFEYNNICYKSCPIGTHNSSYNNFKCEKDLICEKYYNYNYTSCLNDIPEGYYLNDSIHKTIDKCNIKCKHCSLESTINNLCISCNINKNYYPKLNDSLINNSYINCYNEKLEGYALENNIYKPCYKTCKNCIEIGDENNNKCDECISNYTFKDDFINDKNCYKKCNYYYYFDNEDKYNCTLNYNCPQGYKLIKEKNRCIDNCTQDDIYKYEYNNICYKKCPKRTILSNNNYYCEDLNCSICYNINETECLSNIPEGYYINNIELKTIDKCHKDCKTCDKKETINNTNCNSCLNSKYLDFGNCVSNCSNGYYIDLNNIKKCKCSYNIKCLECNIDTLENDLCISCNTEDNYYPKYNDSLNRNNLVKCYKNLDGHFLNNNKYYECYPSCNKCSEIGNEDDNKCILCKFNYTFKDDFENDKNCYKNCDYFYYFDSNNKYHCTSNYTCPNEYYKLIEEKYKCIDNCSKDNIYKYEYNNICYKLCPFGTFNSSNNPFLCEKYLVCEKYYNYNHTECIEKIPEGYYLNNSQLKTIDKCNIKCKNCTHESTKNNLCLSCNTEQNYYPILDNILYNNSFVNCYNEKPEGYALENNIYKPCYKTCKNCTEIGDENNNKCDECISNYEFKDDFINDKNCYKKCNYYYYFDLDNKYHCTLNNKCPEQFNKLIIDKNKCVNSCIDINKYEYNNICYETYPKGSNEKEIIIYNNISLSKDELINNILNIINDTKIGNNYEIKGKAYIIKIQPTNSTYLENSTHVNFDKCEEILRNHYNISNSSILTIFQLELYNDNSQSLINQVEYMIYNDKKVILDLSLCKDINIKVYHSIKEGINLDISSISEFNNSGIDIFNLKDSFFNDLCYLYSISDNDIILEDRIKYIYQNYSLCEEGCTLNYMNYKDMTISCDCKIKENISTIINPINLEQPKESSILDSNIGVAKCYNLVFSFEGKFHNIGFLIILVLFLINIIFLLLYFNNGIKSVIKYVFVEMIIYGYLNKNNRIFLEEVKKNKMRYNKNDNISNPKNKIKDTIDSKFNEKEYSKIKKIENKRNNKKSVSNKKLKLSEQNNVSNYSSSDQKLNIKKNFNGLKTLTKTNKTNKIKYKNEYIRQKLRQTTNITIDSYKGNKEQNDLQNFGIIKVDLNDIKNYAPKDSNQTLHNYSFEEAIKYDKRSILKIFYIYLLSKQIIFHTFFQKSPLELFSLRISLFIFMLSTDLALNSLLYLNDNISKKYHYAKNLFLFTFSNNLTIIFLSTLLSFILISLIAKLNNSTNEIRNVFREEEEKIIKDKNYKITEKMKKNIFLKVSQIFRKYKIKILILIIIELLLILFYWYFITAFCHVFSKTQLSWLLDSFLSFLSRFIIELLFALLFSKLYIISVESNCYTLYRVLLFIYDFS